MQQPAIMHHYHPPPPVQLPPQINLQVLQNQILPLQPFPNTQAPPLPIQLEPETPFINQAGAPAFQVINNLLFH